MAVFLSIPSLPKWRPHQRNPVLIRNHPIARGLLFAEVFHEGKGRYTYDRVRPFVHGDWSSSTPPVPAWVPTDLGTALTVDNRGGSNNPQAWTAPNYYPSFSEATAEIIMRYETVTNGVLFQFNAGVSDIFQLGMTQNVVGLPPGVSQKLTVRWAGFSRTWSENTGDPTRDFIPVPTAGVWYQYFVTKSGADCPVLYINGGDMSTAINTGSDVCGSATLSSAGARLELFTGGFGSVPYRTAVSLRLWNRVLNSTEMEALRINPWVIYDEQQSYTRLVARAFAVAASQVLNGETFADGDYVPQSGAVATQGQIIGSAIADGDSIAAESVVAAGGLIVGAAVADGDSIAAEAVIFNVTPLEEVLPSVDIGGSRDEVYVQVIPSGNAEFVVECSEDDIDFFPATPVLSEATFVHCNRRVPYWRVRRTNTQGSVTSYWGPQEGRTDGHEKDVVSPRIRYSDDRKVH